jgi:hypothetical protein
MGEMQIFYYCEWCCVVTGTLTYFVTANVPQCVRVKHTDHGTYVCGGPIRWRYDKQGGRISATGT